MPRRRHEEERRSSSSPRPAAARSRSRETTTGRSAPQPRARPAPPAAASTPRSSPRPRPAPARSSSPRTERSTPHTSRVSSDDDSYRVRGDGDYSLFEGILRGMRRTSSDDQGSNNDRARDTSHGESLFGDTVRTLLCSPPQVVVSEHVVYPVSPCDTQTKAFQDCLQEFETDISKCQLHMNTLYRCKKYSDSKLEDVVRGMPRDSSDDRASSHSESRFITIVRALLCPRTVAAPVSLCDTRDKAFQDCLHDFETDISKCQLHMNMLSRCKKNSDSK